jgi:hypothetical protein
MGAPGPRTVHQTTLGPSVGVGVQLTVEDSDPLHLYMHFSPLDMVYQNFL